MPWYVYALVASLLFAIIPMQKRKYNHKPKDVMFWSSIFAFIMTLIMMPFLEFPSFDWFYLGAIFTGLSGVFGGILQFKLSEKKIGRTLSLQLPVQVVACFIFFSILQPSYYEILSQNIITSSVLFISLIILMVSAQFLRKSDNSLVSLISIMPISILFAVIIVYYKLMMNVIDGNPSHIILAYIMVHYFTVSLCFLIENIFNESESISISERLTSSSLLVAVLNVFAYYFMFLAVYYCSNPALVLIFNLLVPVWIKLYSYIFKREDDASFKVSIIMILAISIMIVAI